MEAYLEYRKPIITKLIPVRLTINRIDSSVSKYNIGSIYNVTMMFTKDKNNIFGLICYYQMSLRFCLYCRKVK